MNDETAPIGSEATRSQARPQPSEATDVTNAERSHRPAPSLRGLVLLSQVRGDVPPDWYSSQLANLVLRGFLGYRSTIPDFDELSGWDGRNRAFCVSYDPIGCHLRPILINPRYAPSTLR